MRALFTILTILLMTPALFQLHGKTKPHDLTSDYLMRKADDPQVAWQTRVACLDSLIKTRRLDMPTLAELYFKKATLLENENRFTEALQTYRDAANTISGDMPSQYCRLLREKARMCVYTRSYIEGLECASSLALFTKPDSLEKYTFYGHMLLVDLFRSLRNTGAAVRYYKKGRDDYHRLRGLSRDTSMLNNCLAALYRNDAMLRMDTGNFEGVWDDIVKARDLATDSIGRMNAYILLTQLCSRRGEFEQAEYYYQRILSQKCSHPNMVAMATNYALMAARTKSPEEARAIFDRYRPLLDKLEGGAFHNLYFRILYYIALKEGDYKLAIDNLEKAYVINDSIHRSQHQLNTAIVADKYEYELQSNEFDASRKAGQRKTLTIIALVFVIAAIIAVAVVLARRHRKAERAKSELETEIDSINRHHSEEIKETQVSLDDRNRELATMALSMARIEESVNDIQALALDCKVAPKDALQKIAAIIKTLKLQSNTWEIFKERFEEVNPKFFEKLYAVCPTLTNNEIRMASFMLMNLPMNTVADMTNRSVRTVGTIRYMVRRKLGITGSSETWMMKLNMADDSELARLRAIADAAAATSDTSHKSDTSDMSSTPT